MTLSGKKEKKTQKRRKIGNQKVRVEDFKQEENEKKKKGKGENKLKNSHNKR